MKEVVLMAMPTEEKSHFTITEVMEITGLSRNTLMSRIYALNITPVSIKFERNKYITRDDKDRLVEYLANPFRLEELKKREG